MTRLPNVDYWGGGVDGNTSQMEQRAEYEEQAFVAFTAHYSWLGLGRAKNHAPLHGALALSLARKSR